MKDFSKTRKQIKLLSDEKQERASSLLRKIEFMDAQLDGLQEILKKKGWVEEYQNGANQHGLKKSSEGEVYNSLVKNYTNALKNLNDMLPDDAAAVKDPLLDYIAQ